MVERNAQIPMAAFSARTGWLTPGLCCHGSSAIQPPPPFDLFMKRWGSGSDASLPPHHAVQMPSTCHLPPPSRPRRADLVHQPSYQIHVGGSLKVQSWQRVVAQSRLSTARRHMACPVFPRFHTAPGSTCAAAAGSAVALSHASRACR